MFLMCCCSRAEQLTVAFEHHALGKAVVPSAFDATLSNTTEGGVRAPRHSQTIFRLCTTSKW